MFGHRGNPASSGFPSSKPVVQEGAAKPSGLIAINCADLIEPGRVIVNLRVRDKTQLLQELSRLAAPFVALDEGAIYRALQAREQLGSTGVGRGIALPHARVDGIRTLFGMFVRLSHPIAFEAIDETPVDLAFLLLIPPDAGSEHVAALAAISRLLRDANFTSCLRKAESAKAVYRLFTEA